MSGNGTAGTLLYSTDSGTTFTSIPAGGLAATASIAASGSIIVRVPVTVSAAAATQNITYPDAATENDVHTDSTTAQNGTREASYFQNGTVSTQPEALALILLTRTGFTPGATPAAATLAGVGTVHSGWAAVYSVTPTSNSAAAAAWTTAAPTNLATVTRVGFINPNTVAHSTDVSGFTYVVTSTGTSATAPTQINNIAQVFGHSSANTDLLGAVSGSAYRLNADMALGRGIAATAYAKHTDTGFSSDATESYVPGLTRYGGEIAAPLSQATRLRVQADHEDDKGLAPQPAQTLTGILIPGDVPAAGTPVDNSLQTVSVSIDQQIRKAQVSVGLIDRRRTDRIAGSGLGGNSDQLETRLDAPLQKNLSLQAQNDTSLSSGTDAVYTDRTLVGLAWKPKPGVDVRLSHQFFGRGQYSGHSVTSLEAGAEHKDASGMLLSERITLTGGASGVNLQQSLGLGKRWTLAPGLAANVGYEHVNGAFFGRTDDGNRYAQPYAVGQSASSLGVASGGSESVGLEYTRPSNFKASARYETHSSLGGANTVITGAAAGKMTDALTALLAYQEASSSNQLLSSLGRTTTLRLGLAYRDPYRDSFNGLLHYESRRNPSVVPDTILVGSGTGSREQLFAAEGIYAPEWQWEFYGKVARRDSVSFLASDYRGSSRIDLAQARVTYRFRSNMDAVGDLRWIGEHEAGYSSRGIVAEVGYYATPDSRLGLGYSFGRVGDRDFTGSMSSGGVFLRLTAKLNQLGGGFGIQRGALDDAGAPVAAYKPAPTGNASAPQVLPPAEGSFNGGSHD